MKINVYAMLKTLHFTIKNGKSISSALKILSNSSRSKKERKLYEKMGSDLQEGYSFSQSLLKQKVASMDVVQFVSMAEKSLNFKTALEKILRYLKVKQDFERESNEKISLPVIYFSIATLVVIGVKFFAVPMQLEKINGYEPIVKKMVETHLEHAQIMTDALFILLVVVASYFILLLIALFSQSRISQYIAKQIGLWLPFTSGIIMKFEKFMLFSMIGEMLESGVSFKNVVTTAIQINNVKKFKRALQRTLDNIKYHGKFVLDTDLYDKVELELLSGVGTSRQVGSIMKEISERARADSIELSVKFFRLITIASIFLLSFAVFIEFWTVVLSEILIQKGFIDMAKSGKLV